MNRFKSVGIAVLAAVVMFGGIQVANANSPSSKSAASTKAASTKAAPTTASTDVKCKANNKDGNKAKANNKDGQKSCGGGGESTPPFADGLNIYFKNELGATPNITRTDLTTGTCNTQGTNVNFSWPEGEGPSGCNTDGFTGFATGIIIWPGTTGDHTAVTFYSSSDDGSFVVIDGATIIDNWVDQSAADYNATSSVITKTAGNVYSFKAYFHENVGGAVWKLFWSYSGQATTIIPVSAFSSTCALGGTCVVGNTGLGGGKVFYVTATPFACGSPLVLMCRYLEAAPSGWSVANAPSPSACNFVEGTSTSDPGCEWSGNTTVSVGTTTTGIGTGYKNTDAIINQVDDGNIAGDNPGSTPGRAATASRAYQGGSQNDWFLPSKDELNELCRYAKMQTTGTNTSCAWGETIRSGFTSDSYWSSSEGTDAPTDAWAYRFSDGTLSSPRKYFTWVYVRPVRAF